MTEAILATIITGVISIAGTIITVVATNKSTIATLDKKSELSDERIHGEINVLKSQIDTLSQRVEKHNNLVERMVVVEQSCKSAHHRLDEMGGHKE